MVSLSEQVVSGMYSAIAGADMERFVGALDPEVVWTVPGQHSLAGTFSGVPAVLAHLAEVVQRTEGNVQLDVLEVLPGDHYTTAVVDVRMTVGGVTVDDRQVHVFEVLHDRITSVREYHGDEQAFVNLFS